ncbi:C45 family autoproteolytic acyltransferase/hydolase [Tistrella mobilis]
MTRVQPVRRATAAELLSGIAWPIRARGTARARGHSIGQALGPAIRAFLDEDVAHLDRLRPEPLGREAARRLALDFAAPIGGLLPQVMAEIEGLAEGAGIPVVDALILQLRRELAAPGSGPVVAGSPQPEDRSGGLEGCTTLAFTGPGGNSLIAQTADLPGDMDGLGTVLDLDGDGPGGRSLAWAPLGQLGFLGVNQAGLAIGINMVVAPGWQVAPPPYLIVRHLLGLGDADAAEAAIIRLPRATSRCYTLADRTGHRMIETTIDACRRLDPDPETPQARLAHCNHYLHPDLAPLDRVPAWSSTRLRTARLDEIFAESPWAEGAAEAGDARAVLADHANAPLSICAHGRNSPRLGRTVASVILDPAARQMAVALGTACDTAFTTYRLEDTSWNG